ncbi:MarR family winged helix-turn-helix transcriptional regulator [Streptomyces sp. NPDC002577]
MHAAGGPDTDRVPEKTDLSRLTPDMVGFRLLKLTNLLSRPFRDFARSHSLTLNEWRVIVVVAARPGSSASEIATATGLLPMNISRALAGLRKSGRIMEERDPADQRRTLVHLTALGRRTFEEIAPHSEEQARRLLEVLDDEQIAALGKLVDVLISRAEQMVGE